MNELEEARYFGSDLNKFMNEKCRHGSFIVNNIDCITYCYEKLILRINESKHNKENWKSSQHNILQILAEILRHYNQTYSNKGKQLRDDIDQFNRPLIMPNKCELFIIKGDYPYNELEAHNMIDYEFIVLDNQEDIIKWLEYNA